MAEARSWALPGALLDALRDTRDSVAAVDLPFEADGSERARSLAHDIVQQLDEHLIPRMAERAAPAVAVVAGSTGSGKSTLVNALVGAPLTEAGVLRPTTKVPHLFHHPNDGAQLSSVARRARVIESAAVPRGLALVDSPDIDSLVGENREIARDLLDAADLWIFVTTAARYGDAVPWEALRMGADRGAAIAVVLNRVTADSAAHVRRDLVERLRREGLDNLPLFVIPEEPRGLVELPPDVVQGIGRWLDQVAEQNAATVVERTLHGATEALKEWLEKLAEAMDDRAAALKAARAAVRRAAAHAEQDAGDFWYRDVGAGPLGARWAKAAAPGGPLFKVRANAWSMRRAAREQRARVLEQLRRELVDAVRDSLAFLAGQAAERMHAALGDDEDGAAAWLLALRGPEAAREAREAVAHEAALGWLNLCRTLAEGLPAAPQAVEYVGEEGLTTVFASAALGIPAARQVLALLVGPGLQELFEQARAQLASSRRYCVNREALETIRPTDRRDLAPDASSLIRLRRAELRSLL